MLKPDQWFALSHHPAAAWQVGLVPLLELLLQNGARAGWADAAGRQPLHYAVLAGRTEAAKLMV